MRLNSKGMSLIELVVSAGAMAVLSLSATSLIKNVMMSQTTSQFNFSRNDLRNEIRQMLYKPEECRCSLSGLVVDPVPSNTAPYTISSLSYFEDPSNCAQVRRTIVSTANRGYPNIDVNRIQLNNFKALDTGQVIAHLQLDINSAGIVFGAGQALEDMPILLQVDSGGHVIGCGAQEADSISVPPMIRQPLVKGERIYSFPGVTGQAMGLVKLEFRGGQDYNAEIRDLNTPTLMLSEWQYVVGEGEDLRSGDLMAMVPLVDGQVRIRFNMQHGSGNGSTVTLYAIFPPP